MPHSHGHEEWFASAEEGQLSVDVFRQGNDLVVWALLAGVKPDDLDINVHGDLLTIRGERHHEVEMPQEDWLYHECYWGAFSRSVVLPYDVKTDEAKASFKNGLLEVRIPIRDSRKKLAVKWES